MKSGLVWVAMVMVLALLLACGPTSPETTPAPQTPETEIPSEPAVSPRAHLTPTPVETSMPIYGGTLVYGHWTPRSFDAHQLVGYGPTGTLPTFNQLVMFDCTYKETVPENIIGDLAESWELNQDGTEITFKLQQGVKWHDGVPFTADDVIYSLDKMTDVNRSAISDWFPAYQSSEKIDDLTVKVHLKYASAGFMISLAQGESQIQAKHLAGTNDQSEEFMVGTGPFILTEYLVQVHIKWRRNPDYFKKDQYGNQLPYLDGLIFYHAAGSATDEMLIGRRLDFRNPTTGSASVDNFENLKSGAPELLWQKRDKDWCSVMLLNIKHKPLDDIRVRRALGLLIEESDLIVGYCGDATFGITDIGLLQRSFGLPAEEVRKLMGWEISYNERVAEAQRLMAEAGYPDGFELNIMCTGSVSQHAGVSLVFADALRKYLKIDSTVNAGISAIEIEKRLDADNYDIYTTSLNVGPDPAHLQIYFKTGGYANESNYSNLELDSLLDGLDRITDPMQRREDVWQIERVLLTDLPALPTGCFIANFMPYYPHVKNLRFTNMSYSNVNRLEDVWIDPTLKPADFGT